MKELSELERLVQDIRAIAYHMSDAPDDPTRERKGIHLKLTDLIQKLETIEQLAFTKPDEKSEKPSVNVAVLSVIEKEFLALNDVFDFAVDTNKKRLRPEMLRIWQTSFRNNDNQELSLLFANAIDPGNLRSFLVTNTILKHFNVDLMILCGIAAGIRGKSRIYSAIISDNSVYYEPQALRESGETQKRFEPLNGYIHLEDDWPDINMGRWKSALMSILENNGALISEEELEIETAKISDAYPDWIAIDWESMLNLEKGIIYSGEKLIADGITGSELAQANQIGKEVAGIEMEGYGFAYACERNDRTPWLIFRGISDFGGPEKASELCKEHQIIAAYSAAVLVKEFLTHAYSPKNPA